MLSKLPPSKTENIVVQNLESELLIYDLVTNKVFCLNETSALVYKACDGKTDLADFKNKHQFPDELIFLALNNLKKEGLIENNFDLPLNGLSKREFIKKIGLSTVAALPIITAINAPTVYAAASCGGTQPTGHIFGCVPAPENCTAMGSPQCQSCSATATLSGACPPAAPLICVCD